MERRGYGNGERRLLQSIEINVKKKGQMRIKKRKSRSTSEGKKEGGYQEILGEKKRDKWDGPRKEIKEKVEKSAIGRLTREAIPR